VINTVIGGRYYITEYIGSAAFSKVVQAQDLHNGVDVCLKIIKNDKDFFDQSLDEIKLLKHVNKHDPADEHHILRLYDYFYHQVRDLERFTYRLLSMKLLILEYMYNRNICLSSVNFSEQTCMSFRNSTKNQEENHTLT